MRDNRAQVGCHLYIINGAHWPSMNMREREREREGEEREKNVKQPPRTFSLEIWGSALNREMLNPVC